MEMKGGLRRFSKEVSILRHCWSGMRLKDDLRLRMRCIGRGTGDDWRGGDFPGRIKGNEIIKMNSDDHQLATRFRQFPFPQVKS